MQWPEQQTPLLLEYAPGHGRGGVTDGGSESNVYVGVAARFEYHFVPQYSGCSETAMAAMLGQRTSRVVCSF